MLTREVLEEKIYELKKSVIMIAIEYNVEEDDYLSAIKEKFWEFDLLLMNDKECNLRILKVGLMELEKLIFGYLCRLENKKLIDNLEEGYLRYHENYQTARTIVENSDSLNTREATKYLKNIDFLCEKIKSKGGKKDE